MTILIYIIVKKKGIMTYFAKIQRSCVNALFPDTCAVCGYHLTDNLLPICAACMRSIRSAPIPNTVSSEFLRNISACRVYDGTIKKCIHQLKFCGKRSMTRVFCKLIRDHFYKNITNQYPVDIVLPVPISPERRRKRGFNQARLIAETLPPNLRRLTSYSNLVKTRNTPPQTGLTRKERMQNLKDAFAIKPSFNLVNKKILLIDDVITTGATLDTCAKELQNAGAGEIHGLAIARTL